jgi:hypothetical protein
MRTFVHVSPTGKILGIHRTYYPQAKAACEEGEIHEIDLAPELAHLPFGDLTEGYRWHAESRPVVKK